MICVRWFRIYLHPQTLIVRPLAGTLYNHKKNEHCSKKWTMDAPKYMMSINCLRKEGYEGRSFLFQSYQTWFYDAKLSCLLLVVKSVVLRDLPLIGGKAILPVQLFCEYWILTLNIILWRFWSEYVGYGSPIHK